MGEASAAGAVALRRSPAIHRLVGVLALMGLCLWGALVWQGTIAGVSGSGFFDPLGIWGLPAISHVAPAGGWLTWASPALAPTLPGTVAVSGATGGFASLRACTASGNHSVNSDLVIGADEWVCGDVATYNGSLIILGRVSGDAQALNGSITISGEVDGSVTALHGDVRLLAGARVSGDVSAIGGAVYRDPQASVGGQIQQGLVGPHMFSFNGSFSISNLGSLALSLLFWVCASAVVAGFFPERLGYVRYIAQRHFWRSFFSGALVFVVGLLVGVVLFITCIGIPILLALGVALWLAWVVGTLAIATWVGEWLVRLAPTKRRPSLLFSAIFGSIVLTMAKELPCVGPTLGILIGGAAIGAAILALLSARTPPYSRSYVAL
ncbi:MAG: polymer-forming cytoskeletal protein [Ktedonobacterales bacterium]